MHFLGTSVLTTSWVFHCMQPGGFLSTDAATMFVYNIGGEELWWRGYVLPRQELGFGRATWVVHGILWSAFHLFMQPTLWDTLRMSITGLALSFVAQRTKSRGRASSGTASETWLFFLSLVNGVRN
jgi:membrane protease YdiL (CAAX protease family)